MDEISSYIKMEEFYNMLKMGFEDFIKFAIKTSKNFK